MSGREQAREGWWRRMQPILNKELGWFGLPVPPSAVQLVERADLPIEAKELVRRVVKRTRLRRGEKRDVARELCGHFQDGIESGAEVSELIRLFGDEKAAAKLIRRGKLRNRGIIWKSWIAIRWGALGVVGVFLCAYAIFAVRLALSERVISHDYLAEFNAPALAVPVEERGWTILSEVESQLRVKDDEMTADPDDSFDPWDARPGDSYWNRALAFLDTRTDAISVVQRAGAARRLAFVGVIEPTDDTSALSGSLINVLLPHLGTVRWASKLLALDSRRASTEGDGDRIVLNASAISSLARGAAEFPSLICGLVGISIDALLSNLIGETLRDSPEVFSDANLRDLAHVLGASSPSDLMANSLRGERAFYTDALQRLYTDDGHGDGLLDAAAMSELSMLVNESAAGRPGTGALTALGPIAAMTLPGRRDAMEMGERFYGGAERRMATPMWEWQEDGEQDWIEELDTNLLSRVRHYPLLILAPAISRSATTKERGMQMHDATMIAIALELHRRREGAWPKSLEDLVPALLPSVPRDRFTGGPIGYALRDGMPVVYSVGLDRDDDGGRAPAAMENDRRTWNANDWISREALAKAMREAPESVPDGDWILWPPQKD